MPLNPGRLNRRIVIQQRSTTPDAAGQPVESWSTLATVWADIKAPTGAAAAERLAANRELSLSTYAMRIRYRTDVTAGMRVVDEASSSYDIAQVIPDLARHEHTDLVCVAGGI